MTVAVAVQDTEAETFRVRLPRFEGPLQLLLHLVESQQLDLLTIPLAELADAYVAHLAAHPVEPRHLAEFIAIAARLILLKSRRLLPDEPVVSDGDVDAPDEEELRRRLVEYRAVRDAAARLGVLDGARPAFRREPRESDLPPAPAEGIEPLLLVEAVRGLRRSAEAEPPAPEIVAREITIAEQIATLRAAIGGRGRAVLQEILAHCRSRTEAAVTLLAMLELVRRREVRIDQRTPFGPITMSLASPEAAT